MKFWINGHLEQDDTAKVEISDRSFLLGDGIFETFCILNGVPQDLEAHMKRLSMAQLFFGIPTSYSIQSLAHKLIDLIKENDICDGSARITISRGVGPRGLLPPEDCKPTVLITCQSSAVRPGEFPPIGLYISSIRRNETSPASKFKTTGGYLDNILALREAKLNACDDAIMLNSQGFLTCTTSANIFLKFDQEWVTPPIEDGILNGIERDKFIHDLEMRKESISIRSVNKSDISNAREIIVTNSLIGRRLAYLGPVKNTP